MITYLKGILVSKNENAPSGCNITVEVNNIGYLVQTNHKTISSLPALNSEVVIYTALIHREDTMFLCGFNAHEDRDLFNILQSVSGIGTKVALLLLEPGAHPLVNAVISADVKALTKTKGVGPKLAQRVILELRDKMTNWRDNAAYNDIPSCSLESYETKESYIETESVLLSLGYSREETCQSIEKALSLAKDQSDSEELLRHALKWLSDNE